LKQPRLANRTDGLLELLVSAQRKMLNVFVAYGTKLATHVYGGEPRAAKSADRNRLHGLILTDWATQGAVMAEPSLQRRARLTEYNTPLP
jgi:hypothetical protein